MIVKNLKEYYIKDLDIKPFQSNDLKELLKFAFKNKFDIVFFEGNVYDLRGLFDRFIYEIEGVDFENYIDFFNEFKVFNKGKYSVPPKDSIYRALFKTFFYGVYNLLVFEEDSFVGYISLFDLLSVFVR